ncbi:MAG: hypothetical protein FWG06_02735, partial [Clostridiales bacterium]|nr:hypothetical protein [Clostridiales bacterium]
MDIYNNTARQLARKLLKEEEEKKKAGSVRQPVSPLPAVMRGPALGGQPLPGLPPVAKRTLPPLPPVKRGTIRDDWYDGKIPVTPQKMLPPLPALRRDSQQPHSVQRQAMDDLVYASPLQGASNVYLGLSKGVDSSRTPRPAQGTRRDEWGALPPLQKPGEMKKSPLTKGLETFNTALGEVRAKGEETTKAPPLVGKALDMAGNIAGHLLLPGGSNTYAGVAGASSFGHGYDAAIGSGAERGEAFGYSLPLGLMSAAGAKAFGAGHGKLGAALGNKLTPAPLRGKLAGAALQNIVGTGAVGATLQEGERLLSNAALGSKREFDPLETLKAFGLSAAHGAVLTGINLLQGRP